MELIVMFERWQNKATSFHVSKVKHKEDTGTCRAGAGGAHAFKQNPQNSEQPCPAAGRRRGQIL